MELGHQVDVSDLYEDGFNPVSDAVILPGAKTQIT